MPHRVPCGRESPGVLGAPVSTALGRAGRRASHPRASRPLPPSGPPEGFPLLLNKPRPLQRAVSLIRFRT